MPPPRSRAWTCAGRAREAVIAAVLAHRGGLREFVMQHELPADVEPATVMRHD